MNVMTTLNAMLEGLIGEAMRAYLHKTLCDDLGSALPLIYSGGSLLMGGLLIHMGLTFWLGWKGHMLT